MSAQNNGVGTGTIAIKEQPETWPPWLKEWTDVYIVVRTEESGDVTYVADPSTGPGTSLDSPAAYARDPRFGPLREMGGGWFTVTPKPVVPVIDLTAEDESAGSRSKIIDLTAADDIVDLTGEDEVVEIPPTTFTMALALRSRPLPPRPQQPTHTLKHKASEPRDLLSLLERHLAEHPYKFPQKPRRKVREGTPAWARGYPHQAFKLCTNKGSPEQRAYRSMLVEVARQELARRAQ
jgi:hypothetical protein